VVGDADDRPLVEQCVLGQHPVEGAAELGGDFQGEAAVDPAWEDRRGNAVADDRAGDALAHGDDLAGAIGDRYDVRFDGQRVPPAQDHQLAKAKRGGANLDEHLGRAGLGDIVFAHGQPVDPGAEVCVITLHGLRPRCVSRP
jgi:hypothetical protein